MWRSKDGRGLHSPAQRRAKAQIDWTNREKIASRLRLANAQPSEGWVEVSTQQFRWFGEIGGGRCVAKKIERRAHHVPRCVQIHPSTDSRMRLSEFPERNSRHFLFPSQSRHEPLPYGLADVLGSDINFP